MHCYDSLSILIKLFVCSVLKLFSSLFFYLFTVEKGTPVLFWHPDHLAHQKETT